MDYPTFAHAYFLFDLFLGGGDYPKKVIGIRKSFLEKTTLPELLPSCPGNQLVEVLVCFCVFLVTYSYLNKRSQPRHYNNTKNSMKPS